MGDRRVLAVRHVGTFETPGIEEEFNAATTGAVLMDRSSVGKLRVTGAEGLDLLHRLSTNDLLQLKPLTARGTVFATDKARIVDFVRVLAFSDSLLLIGSGSEAGRLKEWIEKYIIMEDVKVADVTPDLALYSIIGPQATLAGQRLFGPSCVNDSVSKFPFANAEITIDLECNFGIDCLNILTPQESARAVWGTLREEMTALGFTVMGASAYEVFRIFQGIPLGGSELTDSFNPYEVGLSPWISTRKGCYIGQEVIARLETYNKVQRRSVRICFAEVPKGPSRRLQLGKEGDDVGILTSFAGVSIRREYFGIGVVRKNEVSIGSTLNARDGSTEYKGVVTAIFDFSRR